jgi:Tfp pilus assembly protein PilP
MISGRFAVAAIVVGCGVVLEEESLVGTWVKNSKSRAGKVVTPAAKEQQQQRFKYSECDQRPPVR